MLSNVAFYRLSQDSFEICLIYSRCSHQNWISFSTEKLQDKNWNVVKIFSLTGTATKTCKFSTGSRYDVRISVFLFIKWQCTRHSVAGVRSIRNPNSSMNAVSVAALPSKPFFCNSLAHLCILWCNQFLLFIERNFGLSDSAFYVFFVFPICR